LLAGCVTAQIEGTSSADMKRQMESSFLFAGAELFYPAGLPADPASLPDLGPAEIAQLQRQLSATLDSLRRTHALIGPVLGRQLERPIPLEAAVRVAVVDTGRPVARIAPDGEISLDVKVVQAMFRAALVSTFETEILLPRVAAGETDVMANIGNAEGQRVAVREMLALKAQVEHLEGRSILREAWVSVRSEEGSSDYSVMQTAFERSNVAERSYRTQQIFLLGHELGHAVLGHLEPGVAEHGCDTLGRAEEEADLYAAFALAISTPADAVQDLFGLFGRSLAEGLKDMFGHTYEFAGFAAPTVAARCPPLDPAERGRKVREAFDMVRSTQIDRLLKDAKVEKPPPG
jgi:hypothetical protein